MPVTSDAAANLAGNDVVATPAPGPQPAASDLPNQIPAQPVPTQLAVQPSQPAQPQAQIPNHVVRDSVLGKGIKALVGLVHGTETNYSVDPSGNMVETSTPAKPGAIFRNILAGALIGGAVGARGFAPPTEREHDGAPARGGFAGGGFAGGFARGGAAAIEAGQAQDQQKRLQARQQFQDQAAAQREKREAATALSENQVRDATIAHLHAETSVAYQNMATRKQEEIERKNAAARAMVKDLEDNGGVRAKISINGTPKDTMSALELAQEYSRNPSIRRGPDGSSRVFIDTHDLSRLQWDGQRWRDDSGNVADMGEHSQVAAYDIPEATMKSHRQVGGDVINKLAGAPVADPKKQYDTTGDALLGLYTVGLKNKNTAAQADQRERNATKRAEAGKKFAEIEAKKASALAKAEQTYWTAINSGKVDEQGALTQLNQAKQNAQDAYEAEVKATGGTAQRFQYGKAPQPAAASPNVDRALGLISKLPKDQQAAQIKSSTKLSSTEKQQALQRIGAVE